jgi:hypothetical protein
LERTPSGMFQVFQRAGSIVQADVRAINKRAPSVKAGSMVHADVVSSGKDIAADGMLANRLYEEEDTCHVRRGTYVI